MEKENKLGTMPISKLIINMSLPIIISMLVQALYNIVDSVFVSRVCEQALTAVSLAFPAQNLMIGLATGTAVGVNALLGRALGAGDGKRADQVAINGIFLAVEKGKAGESYILANEIVTYPEFATLTAQEGHCKKPMFYLPKGVANFAADILEKQAKKSGKKPALTRYEIYNLARNNELARM